MNDYTIYIYILIYVFIYFFTYVNILHEEQPRRKNDVQFTHHIIFMHLCERATKRHQLGSR